MLEIYLPQMRLRTWLRITSNVFTFDLSDILKLKSFSCLEIGTECLYYFAPFAKSCTFQVPITYAPRSRGSSIYKITSHVETSSHSSKHEVHSGGLKQFSLLYNQKRERRQKDRKTTNSVLNLKRIQVHLFDAC